MVGIHVIQSLKTFHVEPILSPEQRAAILGNPILCIVNH